MSIKFKKLLLPVFLGALSTAALLSPSLTPAVEETGSIAASKATDQKAALAKKARLLAEKKAAEAAAATKSTGEAKEHEVEKEVEKEVETK